MANKVKPLPQRVAKRIRERAARGERAVVVIIKDGEPRSVWGVREYLERQQLGRKVGQSRKGARKASADPLGAVDMGKILVPLTRENIYADE